MASITGIGVVCAGSMGCGRDRPRVNRAAGPLPLLRPKEIFRVPCQRFNRMDAFTQYSMVAIAFALRDAGLEEWDQKRPIGITASSAYGCLDTDIRYYNTVMPQNGALASPQMFAYTLASSFLGEAAIHFGLDGPSYVLNERPRDHRMCLMTALLSLSAGECDTLLAGASDLECPSRFPHIGKRNSGFLYFVIRGEQSRSVPNYGVLKLNQAGDILFQDRVIVDFWTLADACLKSALPFKET
jgi:3-oxoacyl-[acyl-carrier-protein] synthase II